MSVKKYSFLFIVFVLLTLGMFVSLQSVLAAWVPPTAPPPAQNVAEPITTADDLPNKLGGIGLNTAGNHWTGLFVTSDDITAMSIAPLSLVHFFQLGAGPTAAFQVDDDYNGGLGDDTPFIIDADGNVGVKTLAPAGALDVGGPICINGDCRISWNDVVTGTGGVSTFWASSSAGYFHSRFPTENVAIGRYDPGAYKLYVDGDFNVSNNICIADSCISSWSDPTVVQTLQEVVTAGPTSTLPIVLGGEVGGALGIYSSFARGLFFDGPNIDYNFYINNSDNSLRISKGSPTQIFDRYKFDGNGLEVTNGNSADWSAYRIGRTATEGYFAIGANPGDFFSGSAAGDLAVKLNDAARKIHIGVDAGGPAGVNPPELTVVDGRVGIGDSAPSALLTVGGDAIIDGILTVNGNDLAEEFSTREEIAEGTVLVMGEEGYKSARSCTEEYDPRVIGVVSNDPSVVMGHVISEHKAVVALTGVVKVKVTDYNGKISRGDLLVTSAVRGHAMKASDPGIGTVLGKALEDFAGGQGEIMVLVNLQ